MRDYFATIALGRPGLRASLAPIRRETAMLAALPEV